MKIALLGDLHLGRSVFGFDLSPYIQKVMWWFFEFCCEHQVEMAIQLGDVFDTPTPKEEHRKLVVQWCNLFERSGIHLSILVGNHDCLPRDKAPSALQYLKSQLWERVSVFDRPSVIKGLDGGPINLLMLPFPSSGIYKDEEEYLSEVWSVVKACGKHSNPRLAFAHLNVDGAKLGNQEFVFRGADYSIPGVLRNGMKFFCGHVHRPQALSGVEILGAAERLRFDEVGQIRQVGLIDVSGIMGMGLVGFKRYVRVDALDLVSLDVDAVGADTASVIARLGGLVPGAVVKVCPVVDDKTVVQWDEVEAWAYSKGALHVHIAPPKRVGRKRARGGKVHRSPSKLASRFIRSRVGDRDEAKALLEEFKRHLAEVE
jgi:hypothetical protein